MWMRRVVLIPADQNGPLYVGEVTVVKWLVDATMLNLPPTYEHVSLCIFEAIGPQRTQMTLLQDDFP